MFNRNLCNLFPVVAVVAFAPLTSGVLSRLKEIVQGKRRPSIFQPYRDLCKRFHKDEIEYSRNFVIHKIFERRCEIGLCRLSANRILELFDVRFTEQLRSNLGGAVDQTEHSHQVFRCYCKNAFLKRYEKFCTSLRNELCSNNLRDFGFREGLEYLNSMLTESLAITTRFAGLQAQWLNIYVGFALLQRVALPITTGSVRYDDLRKLKGHGLLERDGSCHAYRLTGKAIQAALLFLFFHKRLCAPFANSGFHPQPDPTRPQSKLEVGYHKADKAIQDIFNLLAAVTSTPRLIMFTILDVRI